MVANQYNHGDRGILMNVPTQLHAALVESTSVPYLNLGHEQVHFVIYSTLSTVDLIVVTKQSC